MAETVRVSLPAAHEPAASVGGPVSSAWREATLTRAKELESLCAWVGADHLDSNEKILVRAIHDHIGAARDAAMVAELNPRRRLHLLRTGPLRERAMSNLDAAEALLLDIAPADYVLGQMPSLLQHVRAHLVRGDARREELERIARCLGIGVTDRAHPAAAGEEVLEQRRRIVELDRGQIVTAARAASSASLREQVRLRSFRAVVVVSTLVLTLLAVAIAIMGWFFPALV